MGPSLKALRVRMGISQAELGRRMGVASSTITNIESGARQPGMDVLARWLRETDGEVRIVPREAGEDEDAAVAKEERTVLSMLRQLDTRGWAAAVLLMRLWPALSTSDRDTLLVLLAAWEARRDR